MRLLIAPDKFAGTLTALEAAQAVAEGWLRRAPGTEIDLAPLSDGGPGFVEVVRAALGGETVPVVVTGPLGDPVAAELLVVDGEVDGDGEGLRTAYVEAAQACGLHLVPLDRRDPGATTTSGVGELVAAAIDAGARRVVVGLGGSATNDGGAGLLAALGARVVGAPDPGTRDPATRDRGPLTAGGAGLCGVGAVDLAPARARIAGVELVAASDVDNPLLGLHGASAVFGPQKGAGAEQVLALDAALEDWAEATDRSLVDRPGSGAAGGLGFGLALLGAERVPGIATVLGIVGLDARARLADVVITGEGSFDWQSLRGKVVSGVAEAATRAGRPCVVLAGRVEVGRREMAATGVAAAYSITDQAGSPEAAMSAASTHLADLAERIAGEWSRA